MSESDKPHVKIYAVEKVAGNPELEAEVREGAGALPPFNSPEINQIIKAIAVESGYRIVYEAPEEMSKEEIYDDIVERSEYELG